MCDGDEYDIYNYPIRKILDEKNKLLIFKRGNLVLNTLKYDKISYDERGHGTAFAQDGTRCAWYPVHDYEKADVEPPHYPEIPQPEESGTPWVEYDTNGNVMIQGFTEAFFLGLPAFKDGHIDLQVRLTLEDGTKAGEFTVRFGHPKNDGTNL